ncbi:MAG: response regulator transcription factor [Spirochaetota bacterium]|nr:response regulator transcription factor [Spirochaetota bacterium]
MEKRIIIIDDHPIVRKGFAQLINREKDLRVVGEAEDQQSARETIEKTSPDLALVDLTLKESDGLELIKDITVLYPKVKTLVISLHDERVYAERALRAGAKGYIMKSEATENVMTAIRQVLKGSIYLSSDMQERILQQYADKGAEERSMVDILSDREFEVFQLIGEGLDTRSIAGRLTLSVKTIETYKAHIKNKLNLQSSTELIQRAVEWNLLQR